MPHSNPDLKERLKFFCTCSIDELHQFFEANLEECSHTLTSPDPYKAECYVCQRQSLFSLPDAQGHVNWRESLKCESCQLINRWRSCFHLFEELAKPSIDSSIYITEAITPLYDLVISRYPNTKGSEYSPSVKFGEHVWIGKRRVHNQDVTNLTFADGEFDCVLSFDVLEHVPGYERALLEFARVLKGGGYLLMSVPFTFQTQTLVRAVLQEDGTPRHLLEPEYHGDPLSDQGVLCFQTFGMDLLDRLEEAGFDDCSVCCYASKPWAYLGANILFVARKSLNQK